MPRRAVLRVRLLPLALVLPLVLPAGPVTAGEEAVPGAGGAAEIAARLQSDEPREIAWGAYLAGEQAVGEAIPHLEAALRAATGREGDEWKAVRRGLLDALIRLDAVVPAALLQPIRAEFRTPFLVLVARDAAIRVDLFREIWVAALDRDGCGPAATACGNFLLRARAPGFAGPLLSRVEATLDVSVVDSADAWHGRGGRRTLGIGHGDGWARIPEGFPPFVAYALTGRAGPGCTLFADGPRPVYLLRRERSSVGVLGSGTWSHVDTAEAVREWLTALLAPENGELPLPERASVRVVWDGAADYRVRVLEARQGLLDAWAGLARRLVALELATLEECRGIRPRIEVEVQDDRAEPREPLPELPPVAPPSPLEPDPTARPGTE